jgi:hypothetical protein
LAWRDLGRNTEQSERGVKTPRDKEVLLAIAGVAVSVVSLVVALQKQ